MLCLIAISLSIVDDNLTEIKKYVEFGSIPRNYQAGTLDFKNGDNKGYVFFFEKGANNSRVVLTIDAREDFTKRNHRRAAFTANVNETVKGFQKKGWIVDKNKTKIPNVNELDYDNKINQRLVFTNDQQQELTVEMTFLFTKKSGISIMALSEVQTDLDDLRKWVKNVKVIE
ncbi:MAG: hypothetical protein JNJ77_07545 [Planctomycetia bacterium]|nr:hypothetical protein [Planctomycetia bacterium]